MAKLRHATLLLALVAAPAALHADEESPKATAPGKKGIDPEADRMLRRMTDYLAGLRSFRVMSSSVDEVVTKAGQKVQFAADSEVSVVRPNRLRSEQVGGNGALAFWDDGKKMTLYCKADSTYATVPSPPTIDETIDTVRREFKLDAPGADLLYSRPYDVLTEQVTGGQFIGKESIDGVPANHLAFQGEEVDWQVWVQDGSQPLPLRYVITTKTTEGQPEFAVHLSHWEPQAKVADSVFQFQPPPGAKRVDSFPTSCGAPHGK